MMGRLTIYYKKVISCFFKKLPNKLNYSVKSIVICSFPKDANFSNEEDKALVHFLIVICPFDFTVIETNFSI